jgi:hypothetical protein
MDASEGGDAPLLADAKAPGETPRPAADESPPPYPARRATKRQVALGLLLTAVLLCSAAAILLGIAAGHARRYREFEYFPMTVVSVNVTEYFKIPWYDSQTGVEVTFCDRMERWCGRDSALVDWHTARWMKEYFSTGSEYPLYVNPCSSVATALGLNRYTCFSSHKHLRALEPYTSELLAPKYHTAYRLGVAGVLVLAAAVAAGAGAGGVAYAMSM